MPGVIYHQKTVALQNPDRPDYLIKLSDLYLKVNQLDSAIWALDKLEEIQGITARNSIHKKDLYVIQHKIPEATNELVKLTEHFPKNIEYMGLLAQFYLQYGQNTKAKNLYEKMLLIAPNDPRAHLDLANYYRKTGDFEKSVYHLRIAISSSDLNIDPKIKIFMSFYDLSSTDANIKILSYELLDSLVKAHPKDPKTYSVYADFLSKDKRLEESVAYLKKSRALGATQVQILEQIVLLDADLGWYDSLIVDAEIMLEYYPNQPGGYLMQGLGYLQKNEPTNAIDILESGIMYTGKNTRLKEQFYIYLADANHNAKQHNQSDSYFEKALEINPKNALVLNNYAYYLALRGVKLDKALEMSMMSNTISPLTPTYLDTWAWILFKQGNYKMALKKIDIALALFDSNTPPDFLEHKGDILIMMGEVEDAKLHWNNAKEMGSKSPMLDKKMKEEKYYE